jgi:hypothetical protein
MIVKSKKRIIVVAVKTICFVLILTLLTVCLSYLLRPHDMEEDGTFQIYYAEKKNSLDMVYVGGSAAFVFWEPDLAWEKAGITSSLIGNNTLQPAAIKFCVKEALKTQNPELILIDLRPFQYGYNTNIEANFCGLAKMGALNSVYQMSYSINRIQMINALVPDSVNKFVYYFDVFSCRQIYALPNFLDDPRLAFNEYKSYNNGFAFIKKHKSETFTDVSNVTEKEELSDELKPIWKDLLDYLKTTNKKVLFIVHSYCISKDDQKKYNYLKSDIEANGFDYLNCNDYYKEIGLDYSTDFYNENHVNVLGADKYTAFVTEHLTKNYSLPDRRSDAAYSYWNDDYTKFMQAHEEAKSYIYELIKTGKEE